MILFLEILLLITCLIIINSFVFYPVVVNLLGSNKINTPVKNIYEPTVAIIIAAYNEEKVIAQRIQNIASQDYDLSKIQVYVGSDASSDRTNEILTELKKEYSWLNLLLSEKRMGKAGILNELIQHIDSEIIVFTDANTDFQKDAVKNLVNGFTSEEVGGVCGGLVLTDSDSTRSDGVEESKYWRYETFIKNAEGKLGVSLAANGGIFAIRRSLYRNIPTEKAVTDDLFISLSIVAQGYKFNYKEDAEAKSEVLRSAVPGITILRMPKHLMLYLGQINSQHYVIHSTWAERYSMTSDAKNRINQVVVSDLTLNGKSYLGSLFDRIISMNEIN